MRQVLLWIPLDWAGLPNLPVYGYGAMLFAAFVGCSYLAGRLAKREGIPKEKVQDLAIWFFIVGILGARLNYTIQYWDTFKSPWQFFAIWDGGLVFYGSLLSCSLFYAYYYFAVLKKNNISQWKLMDVIAPCVPLGLALGRVGCLLNGCCYGNVAGADCPAITFPLSAPPRQMFVDRGLQTHAGFTLSEEDGTVVGQVEPLSPAQEAGLLPGDAIVAVQEHPIRSPRDLVASLGEHWPRGETELRLTVRRDSETITLPPFAPRTLGLHPTQIYETISMVLLLLLLLSYYPIKWRDGAVFAGFLLGYALHRFLNEMLRTDTAPVAFNMTYSQNVSIVLALAACFLIFTIWRRPVLPQLAA